MANKTKSIEATGVRINQLHEDLIGMFNRGLTIAIEIGELLESKKTELSHGSFGNWINDNLIFSDRTARNYMNIYRNKDRILEAKTISEAYKMLSPGKTEIVSVFDCDDEVWQSLLKLGALLEQAEPGQVVTGVLHQAMSNQAKVVSIIKHGNVYGTYQMLFIDANEKTFVISNDIPSGVEDLLKLFLKHPKINIKNASWITPGVNYQSN